MKSFAETTQIFQNFFGWTKNFKISLSYLPSKKIQNYIFILIYVFVSWKSKSNIRKYVLNVNSCKIFHQKFNFLVTIKKIFLQHQKISKVLKVTFQKIVQIEHHLLISPTNSLVNKKKHKYVLSHHALVNILTKARTMVKVPVLYTT